MGWMSRLCLGQHHGLRLVKWAMSSYKKVKLIDTIVKVSYVILRTGTLVENVMYTCGEQGVMGS